MRLWTPSPPYRSGGERISPEEGSPVFCEVPVDPRFAPLGVDPRFAELVRGKSGNTRAHAAISVDSRWTAQDTVCHALPS
jgi:hypothetical protein